MIRREKLGSLSFEEVLIVPAGQTEVSSRSEVNLEIEYKGWKGVPIFVANMHSIATLEMAEATSKFKLVTALSKFINYNDLRDRIVDNRIDPNYVALTFGITAIPEMYSVVEKLPEIPFIILDVANGGMTKFHEFCKLVRIAFPKKILIAGNIANTKTADILYDDCGIDIVKFGIGSGSHCLTREKTGVGYPQFGMNILMRDRFGTHFSYMSDGGCNTPGDVCKVFAAGSQFVMLGGMFAGHEECEGKFHFKDGKTYKQSYGMSSNHASNAHYGENKSYKTSEGSLKLIPYKGPVADTIEDILGGVRSMCSYTGFKSLDELYKRSAIEFMETTFQRNHHLDRYDSFDQ